MPWPNKDRHDSDDSDVEDESISCGTVIIFDNSEKMFVASDSNEPCPFQNCLEALYITLDKYVFDQWNNKLCIQLLDEREHGTFFDLSTDLIGIMQKLLEVKAKPIDELKAIYYTQGFDDKVLYESFINACDYLRKGIHGNNVKNIVILTNESDCCNCNADDEDLNSAIESMVSNSVQLIVVPLLSEFDWSKFYGKLVSKAMDDSLLEELTREGYDDVDSLVKVLDRFVHPKRGSSNIIFYYGPGNSNDAIHLQVRKTFKPKKLYHNAKVDPKTLRECVRVINNKAAENEGDEDFDARMWTDEFEPEEGSSHVTSRTLNDLLTDPGFKRVIRCYGTPHELRLLYVSDKRTSAHYVNKPAFIVEPDQMETNDQELELFDCFWQHCRTENKVIVCTYVANRRQKYHLIQLEPQSRTGYNYFTAQFVTFVNGVKQAAREELVRKRQASGANLEIARELVRKLTISDTDRPLEVQSRAYENKAALIRGVLLSTERQSWEPPEMGVNWPSRQQVCAKLGTTLQQQFNQAYVAQVNKRKKK